MEPLRCAIVGVGMIGRQHARILAALPEAELVVCCDVDAERAADVPEGVRFTTSVEETLEWVGLEAVVVCVPQHLHRAIVEPALAAGLAVLCEKPIAHSLADADAMIRAADAEPGPLVIGHTLRFEADYVAASAAVAAGEVGDVVSLAARWHAPDYEGRVISGRATVPQEMMIHDLDVVEWLAGPIERVYAEASPIEVVGPGPDAVVATLRLCSGAVAAFDHGWIAPAEKGLGSEHRLAVFGTSGALFVESRDTPLTIYGARGFARVNTRYYPSAGPVPAGALATEDRHFVRTVREGTAWPISLVEGRRALASAIAIERSLASGGPVDVLDVEDP
jgi:predicted dehydrogenase